MIDRAFSRIRDSLVDGGILMSFVDYKHGHELVAAGKALGMEHLNTAT